MKHRYNFRLSDHADALIRRFITEDAITKTDVIEQALRALERERDALRRLMQQPLLPSQKEKKDEC